jgi:glyoxylase-like metal-dependent hydrolase (beta-lactamase superfamily II)
MAATSGRGFYADVQQFRITDTVTLSCFQPPCGGSPFLLHAGDSMLMIDTGYGIYHEDMMALFARYGLGDPRKLTSIIVTHADADHAGASGFFSVPVFMHEGTHRIIETNDRSYGQQNELSALNAFYTRMVNLFSRYRTPQDIRHFGPPSGTKRGIFPVIGTVGFAGITLEVLDGLGGHCHGQVFLYSRGHGLLFTADSVINFTSMSKERAEYSSLAAFLIGSVNVDSDHAKAERTALLALAAETDETLKGTGRRCLICCGHGEVSVLENGKLVSAGSVEKYTAGTTG